MEAQGGGGGVRRSLANRFAYCDSIGDFDRNRIAIGRIDLNRFVIVIHSDFVVNHNPWHHALMSGACGTCALLLLVYHNYLSYQSIG